MPGAVSEAAFIADSFPEVISLGGENATSVAVLAALGNAEVLHAACHGATDFIAARQSALLLAGHDRLTADDLSRQRIACRLSVLSACETGIPSLALPDEVIGLPASLLQAGAAGVVASLWAVPDTATALLMAKFYAQWRQAGAEPAHALHYAQRWLRGVTNGEAEALLPTLPSMQYAGPAAFRDEWAAARPFGHPVNWAAFCYFGV